jgi:acyl carrier protein
MQVSLTETSILEFLRESAGVDMSDIGPDSLLFSTGVIDSFSLVSLLTFVESSGGFRIEPLDVNLENFDSITRILSYVEGRRQEEQ